MSSMDGVLQRVRFQPNRPRFDVVYLGSFFAVFSALAFLFPFSGDDWAWGSSIGVDRLHTLFRDYNGRYAGNLAVLLLTRAGVLTPLVVAAVVTATIALVVDLTDNRTKTGYLVVTALFLGMPIGIWRESVVWASGFSNYALGTLCALVYCRALKQQWLRPRERPLTFGRSAAIVLFGFTSALFIEHLTLYLVVASAVSLVWHRVARGVFPTAALCWFGSFLGGAVVMFSNGAYGAAMGAGGGYQHVQAGAGASRFGSIFHKVTDVISTSLVTQNTLLNAAVVLMVFLLVSASGQALRNPPKVWVLASATAFLVLTYLLTAAEGYTTSLVSYGLAAVAAGLLLLTLCLTARFFVRDRGRRAMLYAACASVAVMAGPLTLVEPVGPRCFYPTYVFFLGIVSLLLREATADVRGEREQLVPFVGAVTVALLASHLWVYGLIHMAVEDRLASVRAQAGRGIEVVTLKRLPFAGYVHAPDPFGHPWDERFTLFYGLPQGLKIRVLTPAGR